MPESEGDRSEIPEDEIRLATTNPYPEEAFSAIQGEIVTGEHDVDEQALLVQETRGCVPDERMGDGATAIDSIPEELTSADVQIIEDEEVAALPPISNDPAREGIPIDEQIHELTTQQLADAVVSGSIPIHDRITEILPPEQIESAFQENELQGKIQAAFDREVNTYLGKFNEVILALLQDVRDKVCQRFEGKFVEEPDILVEALNIQLVVEAIMTQQFGKLINQGYIQVVRPE
ncbi:hypothetical protein ACFL3C_05160 [Patescibacteria group bacterium]